MSTTITDRINHIEEQLGSNGSRAIAEAMAEAYSDRELRAMSDREFFDLAAAIANREGL